MLCIVNKSIIEPLNRLRDTLRLRHEGTGYDLSTTMTRRTRLRRRLRLFLFVPRFSDNVVKPVK